MEAPLDGTPFFSPLFKWLLFPFWHEIRALCQRQPGLRIMNVSVRYHRSHLPPRKTLDNVKVATFLEGKRYQEKNGVREKTLQLLLPLLTWLPFASFTKSALFPVSKKWWWWRAKLKPRFFHFTFIFCKKKERNPFSNAVVLCQPLQNEQFYFLFPKNSSIYPPGEILHEILCLVTGNKVE